MTFAEPLLIGTLRRRYQRFLVDACLDDGTEITAHCTNTGSLKTCFEPGWRGAFSVARSPRRRLPYTWEMVHNGKGWIGVNTIRANRLAEEAIATGAIPELSGYATILRERRYAGNSRVDLLLRTLPEGGPASPAAAGAAGPDCYVEVKNVSLLGDDGSVAFPDAVTVRGRKHLAALEGVVRAGCRAVMLFVVQRHDGRFFRPAWEIDPEYSHALQQAKERGVEVLAYAAAVSPAAIVLNQALPVHLVPARRGA